VEGADAEVLGIERAFRSHSQVFVDGSAEELDLESGVSGGPALSMGFTQHS
jgi:hypothetical protein